MYESYLIIVYAGSKTYQKDLKFEDFPSVVVSLVLSSLLSSCCCFSRPVAVSLLLSQRIFSSRRYSRPFVASLVLLLFFSSFRRFSRTVVLSLVLSLCLHSSRHFSRPVVASLVLPWFFSSCRCLFWPVTADSFSLPLAAYFPQASSYADHSWWFCHIQVLKEGFGKPWFPEISDIKFLWETSISYFTKIRISQN